MRLNQIKESSDKLTKSKVRIIAHLIADGSLSKHKSDYQLKLEVKDKESLHQFNDDLIEVYGLKPSWWWNTSGFTGKPIPFVRIRSKLAYEDLLRYASYFSKDWKLKSLLLNAPKEIKREFLKIFFDDEGSVKSEREVILYSINSKGLLQIKDMLQEFGIKPKLDSGYGCRRNVYGLIIRDLELFDKEIGFNLKRKQNKLKGILKKRKVY